MDSITTARLEIIAAKARILADKAKGNQFWEGELERGLVEIEREVVSIKSAHAGYSSSKNTWYPEDK